MFELLSTAPQKQQRADVQLKALWALENMLTHGGAAQNNDTGIVQLA
jgi:hypothetical protein